MACFLRARAPGLRLLPRPHRRLPLARRVLAYYLHAALLVLRALRCQIVLACAESTLPTFRTDHLPIVPVAAVYARALTILALTDLTTAIYLLMHLLVRRLNNLIWIILPNSSIPCCLIGQLRVSSLMLMALSCAQLHCHLPWPHWSAIRTL